MVALRTNFPRLLDYWLGDVGSPRIGKKRRDNTSHYKKSPLLTYLPMRKAIDSRPETN
jgi:hypothetical protein